MKIIRLLLEHGADVHAEDSIKCTALHYAANMGNVDIVSTLLQFDANANAKGLFHVTPLHIATSPKVVQMLLRHNANLTAQMIDDTHETCGKTSNNLCICC